MKFAPVTALALLFCVSQANATVYNINGTIGTGSVNGFIKTDGFIGTLNDSHLQDWNLLISADGMHSFDLLGPLSGNNSAEGIFGTALTADSEFLYFNFSLDTTNNFEIRSPSLISGAEFLCLNCFTSSVFIDVDGFNTSRDMLGRFAEIGATPLPATLPLFASGLGALGLLGWRRKRKPQAAA